MIIGILAQGSFYKEEDWFNQSSFILCHISRFGLAFKKYETGQVCHFLTNTCTYLNLFIFKNWFF